MFLKTNIDEILQNVGFLYTQYIILMYFCCFVVVAGIEIRELN